MPSAETYVEFDPLSTLPGMDTPDGSEIAFVQGGEVKVLSLSGGPIRTLGSGVFTRWGSDGMVYADVGVGSARIAPTGGEFQTVYEAVNGESTGVSDVLPGGRHAGRGQ